jgi:hypothetical protein
VHGGGAQVEQRRDRAHRHLPFTQEADEAGEGGVGFVEPALLFLPCPPAALEQ